MLKVGLPKRAMRRLRSSFGPSTTIRRVTVVVCEPRHNEAVAHPAISLRTLASIERATSALSGQGGWSSTLEDDRQTRRSAPAVDIARPDHQLGRSSSQRELRLYLLNGAELTAGSIAAIAEVFNQRADLEMLYSDAGPPSPGLEQEVDEDEPAPQPWLLPGFSPERLFEQMYLGHLIVLRAGAEPQLLDRARLGGEAAVSWSNLGAMARQATQVAHVPLQLHWRSRHSRRPPVKRQRPWPSKPDPSETAADTNEFKPSISIVMPTNGSSRQLRRGEVVLVEQALRSILERSSYGPLEIVVVVTPGGPRDLMAWLDDVAAFAHANGSEARPSGR